MDPTPDIVTKTLKLPGAHIVGESTIDGRPAIEVEAASTGYPPDPMTASGLPSEKYATSTPQPPSQDSERTVISYRRWIDKLTDQVLLQEHSVKYISGPRSGQIITQELRVVRDESIDARELPADFFTFKLPPGATLIEQEQPFSVPTPTLVPASAPSH